MTEEERQQNSEGMESEEIPGSVSPLMAVLMQFSLVIALATYLCTSIYSSEFFGHLSTGHWIVSQGNVPTTDLWTIAGEGKEWKSASWLFEGMLSVVESLFGDMGLLVAKMVFFVFFVWALSWVFSSRAADRFIGTSIAFVVSCGVLMAAPFTPDILGWTLFICTLELAYRYKCATNKRLLVLVFLLGALYANVHFSAVFALAAALCLFMGKPCSTEERQTAFKEVIPFAAVFLASQLCTPYFGTQLLFVLQGFLNIIAFELHFQLNPGTVFNYPVAFLILGWILLALLLHQRPGCLRYTEVLLAAFTSIIGLASVPFSPYGLMLTGLVCMTLWGRAAGEGMGNLGDALSEFGRTLAKLPAVGVLWIALCLIIVNVTRLARIPVVTALLPAKEVDYLLENQLPFPLLHEIVVGPYLQYRFSDESGLPKKRVAIAPHVRQIEPGLALAAERLQRMEPGWEIFFDLISPKTVVCRMSSALYLVLSRDPAWELVFEAGQKVPANLPRETRAYSWAVFRLVEQGQVQGQDKADLRFQ